MTQPKAPSYVQATKRVDKSILTVDYEAKKSKRVGIADVGSILMQRMNIKQDEVLGIRKYSFGVTKGFIKMIANSMCDNIARLINMIISTGNQPWFRTYQANTQGYRL